MTDNTSHKRSFVRAMIAFSPEQHADATLGCDSGVLGSKAGECAQSQVMVWNKAITWVGFSSPGKILSSTQD